MVCLFNISSCAAPPWFHGLEADSPFIRVVSRLMSYLSSSPLEQDKYSQGGGVEKIVSGRTDATEITAYGKGSFSVCPGYAGSSPMK
jgi:hypothetical protein